MANYPIFSLRNAHISFAKKTLFENLNLTIFPNDKICLIGKNGVGKTTLMNAIADTVEIDSGERWQMPNSKIGYLLQDEKLPKDLTILEYLKDSIKGNNNHEEEHLDHKQYLIDNICSELMLETHQLCGNISGGQVKRVNLAKSLLASPDILLLDEPTNHLDIELINWLENYLRKYRGALVIISHDRAFLAKVSNKIFWLRVGDIKINNHGYENFDDWSNSIIEQENREMQNLNKKVDLESSWLQTGVTGRRKRNVGRLHYLEELRSKLNEKKRIVSGNRNKIKIHQHEECEDNSQIVVNFHNVNKIWQNISGKEAEGKIFNDKKILNNFSLKIISGEKIGIIGRNGSGKSTFLKMITKEASPDSGTVKTAINLNITYFDQQRSKISPTATIKEVLCDSGGDYVRLANGKTKHICGYLQDFLFDPKDLDAVCGSLSGGQQNRLLLAKSFANPGNLLILDEPTNDLDMDSLDILQEYLVNYQGSLLVVSHDRDFLDNIATSVLAFEGDGVVFNNIGGYSDYLKYKEQYHLPLTKENNRNAIDKKEEQNFNNFNATKPKDKAISNISDNTRKQKISQILAKIDTVEETITNLTNLMQQSKSKEEVQKISKEIVLQQQQLEKLEETWKKLE